MWDKRDKRVIFLFQYYITREELVETNETFFEETNGMVFWKLLLFMTLAPEKVTFSDERMTFTILKVTFSALKVILLHINMRINIHCHGG